MLQPSLLAALNHLLMPAEWARNRLQPFAGRVAKIDLQVFSLSFRIAPDGHLGEALPDEPADVTLRIPPDALPKAVGGMDAVMRSVRIEGNADFADAIGFVARHLRWDAEEDISRFFGDIAAHRLVSAGQSIASTGVRTVRAGLENLAEYLTHEVSMVVRPSEVEDFASDVTALRDELARLEKRLERLEGSMPRNLAEAPSRLEG